MCRFPDLPTQALPRLSPLPSAATDGAADHLTSLCEHHSRTQLQGGSYGDTLSGGPGNDGIFGIDGNDTVSGGAGNDLLDGGNGDDNLYGEAGNDYLNGADGVDFIDGRPEFDTCVNGESVINCET